MENSHQIHRFPQSTVRTEVLSEPVETAMSELAHLREARAGPVADHFLTSCMRAGTHQVGRGVARLKPRPGEASVGTGGRRRPNANAATGGGHEVRAAQQEPVQLATTSGARCNPCKGRGTFCLVLSP